MAGVHPALSGPNVQNVLTTTASHAIILIRIFGRKTIEMYQGKPKLRDGLHAPPPFTQICIGCNYFQTASFRCQVVWRNSTLRASELSITQELIFDKLSSQQDHRTIGKIRPRSTSWYEHVEPKPWERGLSGQSHLPERPATLFQVLV